MNRRQRILVLSISVLCFCLLVVVAVIVCKGKDILARIEKDINGQGYCMIPGAPEVKIRAQSARMEQGSLVLYGGHAPDDEFYVRVTLRPDMGSEGICSARSVSIIRIFDPDERLRLTFWQPTHLPRFVVGRSCALSLPRMSWICKLKYDTQARIRHYLSQTPATPAKPQGESPGD
jgi:hypothetical protein